MATSSVFNLTRFTALASGDVLPGVDISDLTQSAHGSLDAITIANFFGTVPSPVNITSASATSFAVGRLGATTPAFTVDSSTALQVAGLKVTGAVTGGTVAIVATDSGAATNLTINAKGIGTIGIGSVSTGAVTITPNVTVGGSLRVNGVAAVGGIVYAGSGLKIFGAITSSVTEYGLAIESTFSSAAVTAGWGVWVAPSLAAAAFTMADAYSFHTADWTKGAGSAITRLYGLYVNPLTAGVTNWGVYVENNNSWFNGILNISGAAGGQVKFPATQNASTNANTLDDYEEGTWTPAVGGSATYTTQSGYYVKIGKLVTAWGVMVINSLGTGSSSVISGLPFTTTNDAGGLIYSGAVSYFASLATNVLFIAAYAKNNATSIGFTSLTAAGVTATIDPGIFGNGATIEFSVSYYAAA